MFARAGYVLGKVTEIPYYTDSLLSMIIKLLSVQYVVMQLNIDRGKLLAYYCKGLQLLHRVHSVYGSLNIMIVCRSALAGKQTEHPGK